MIDTYIETDEEIIARMRDNFQVLDDMTRAVKNGHVRALIVSGAPGVGKSFGIERVLSIHDTHAILADKPELKGYDIIKGKISALHLYLKLYSYKEKDNVLVLDDCDEIFTDHQTLHLLKSALDTSNRRVISWLTESRVLADAGIPTKFEFKGGIIFVTNLKKEMTRSPKLRAHLEALESRCHFLDLSIHTDREKILRIKQLVGDGMLSKFRLTSEQESEILDWIEQESDLMRELTLRVAIKAAELVKIFPSNWKKHAEMTLLAQ